MALRMAGDRVPTPGPIIQELPANALPDFGKPPVRGQPIEVKRMPRPAVSKPPARRPQLSLASHPGYAFGDLELGQTFADLVDQVNSEVAAETLTEQGH